MKVVRIEQNSEEWLEFRRGKSGGSAFRELYPAGLPLKSRIVKKLEEANPLPPADKRLTAEELASMLTDEEMTDLKLEEEKKRRYYEMIAERVTRPIRASDYSDRLNGEAFSMMVRGHILEPEAIKAFEKKTGKKVDKDSVVWVSDYDDSAYISPDATITDKDGKCREAVEVKCLDSWQVVRAYLKNERPSEYDAQILKYFMTNEELERVNLVLYTDAIPGLELQVFVVKRSEMEKKIRQARLFEQKILEQVKADSARIDSLSF